MTSILPLKNWFKYIIRKIYPIPMPSDINSYENFCEIELVPYENLIEFYQRSFKKFFHERNHITHLEFGVFNGTSLAAAYHFYNQFNLADFKIIAFDSFKGLPSECESDDGGDVWKEGMYCCKKSQTEECLKNRHVDTSKIQFVEGWYKDTLSSSDNGKLKLEYADVVFIDSDTYSSCCLALNFIKPLIKDSILICFDDWKLKNLDLYEMGESKAFLEFLDKEKDLKAIEIKSYNRKSKSFMLFKTQ